LPATPTGTRSREVPSRRALCSSTSPSPPSVPADQQDHVRARGAQRRHRRTGQRPGRHVHHLGAGGQPDPVPGLGGDQRLVPEHRPAAGHRRRTSHTYQVAGAGQEGPPRRRRRSARRSPRGRHLGPVHQPRGVQVDQEAFVLRRSDVHADGAASSGRRHQRPLPVAVTATIGSVSTAAAEPSVPRHTTRWR
jgi:hypothetical protein